jgi:hypothetical protein
MKFLLPSVFTAVLMTSTACAHSPHRSADNVRVIGSTYLSKAENDRDLLRFQPCRRDVHTIKLQVSRGQVEIENLWIRFANGQVERVNVRERIGQGGESRWINLPGGERCITAIGIVGDTEYSRDQARVRILAR